MVIAFDCDGVTADIATPMIHWHNEVYHTRHELKDLKSYFIRDLWNCSSEEEFRKLDEFYASEYFSDVPMINGAVNGIREITDNISNVALILTARPEEIHNITRKWFRRHFPGRFNGIYFSKAHSLKDNGHKEKAELCRELEVEVIVEDSAENAVKCYNSGIQAIILNQPWNVGHVLPKRIRRAENWKELTKMLI